MQKIKAGLPALRKLSARQTLICIGVAVLIALMLPTSACVLLYDAMFYHVIPDTWFQRMI